MTARGKPVKNSPAEEVEQLVALLREFSLRWIEQSREIVGLKAGRGAVILAATRGGDGVDAQTAQRALLRDREGDLERSDDLIAEAIKQLEPAIRAMRAAEAEEIRKTAGPVRAELERLERQLAEDRRRDLEVYGAERFFEFEIRDAMSMFGGGVASDPVRVKVPRLFTLRSELGQVEQRAKIRGEMGVSKGGAVEGSSIEELVEQMLSDAERIPPHVRDVQAWLQEAEAAERARRKRVPEQAVGGLAEGAPVRYRLVWSEGRVDRVRSAVILPEAAPAPVSAAAGEI